MGSVLRAGGAKIGYGKTTAEKCAKTAKTCSKVDSDNHLTIVRFGQKTEQDLALSSIETPEGQLLEFKTEVSFGPTPLVVTGRVEGEVMVLETSTEGRRQTGQIPWSRDILGFRAMEQSLEQKPMKPGETRQFKMLMPIVNQVADVALIARDQEETSVLGVKTRLLRIDSSAKLADGNNLDSTMWTDAAGRTIKTRMESMQQESFRTTKELAMADEPAGATFDLGSDVLVKPDKPLRHPHAAQQIRYRVESAAGDPAKVFASGPTQTIRSLDPHAAEITVTSLRPADLPADAKAGPNVDKEYTESNSVLQTDDPRIKSLAAKAKGNATQPRDIALALERYVSKAMTKKNFTQAFATAAEVADSREGDCTEHAVLLAALLRACGIPSRVAIGLVYVKAPADSATTCGPSVPRREVDPARRHAGRGRHRRRPFEIDRLQPGRRRRLQHVPARRSGCRPAKDQCDA